MCYRWLVVLLPAAATAQSPLSLREAVDQALAAHPLLAASSGRIAATEGLRRQAALAPNPRLILQNENYRPYWQSPIRFWYETDSFVYFQQTLETAGKRDRRTELAAAGAERAKLERELLSQQIGTRVKLAYWNAAGARETYRLLEQSRVNFRQVVEYNEIRVKEGAIAEADLLRVRLEAERMEVTANAALLEAQRARIGLFRDMGRSEFPEVTFAERLDDPAPPALAADPALALANRPEIRLAQTVAGQARANLRLQQSAATPNMDLLLGYKRTLGQNAMIGGLHFDLPMFNRNQGNLEAAGADIRAAEANIAATEALVRAEVDAARVDLDIRRRQITQVLRPMLGQAGESANIARAAYREGGADLLRLLDAERIRLETEVSYVRALAEYRQSVAALEAAMGIAP